MSVTSGPDIANDRRLDPRLKGMLDGFAGAGQSDAASREEVLAAANTPEALATMEAVKSFMEMCDNEDVAPSTGLEVSTHEFTSSPDGNTIQVQLIRPEGDGALPCVYYIHGGGMQTLSCFDGMYRAWGRIIAGQGVAVAMVDFRNCLVPSSVPEIAPYPAGLNDCVSGLRWVHQNAASLGIENQEIRYDDWMVGDIKVFDIKNTSIVEDLEIDFVTDFEAGLGETLAWARDYFQKQG